MGRGWVVTLGLLAVGCGETVSIGRSAPTYHDDVAPMLATWCVDCHEAGDAVPLDDYAAVADRRLDVLASVLGGTMPPWGDADPQCLPLDTPAGPSGAEVLRLRAWVMAGAPVGDPRPAPEVTRFAPPAVRADRTLEAEAYAPSRRVQTRCFLLDPSMGEDTRITAARLVTARPDQVLFAELRDSLLSIERLQEVLDRDPEPGWACPTPNGYHTFSILALWPGGEAAVRHPEGIGTTLTAGRYLVLRVRYAATEDFEDRPRVELELDPTARAGQIVTHEPVAASRLLVEGGAEAARFEAAVVMTSRSPRTVHAIAPGLPSGRAGRDRVARLAAPDACLVDVTRGAARAWYPFAVPFRLESTELLDLSCTYDTRDGTRDVPVGPSDAEIPCGAHFFVTPWMPSDG